ncbi:MAG: LCP family protein, partial [Rhodococcus sp. (in: high G+C Gram-positive bacteria)]|nr:LCP family protein [Rhodococcus sp. (in: high G+C Gram-positive bacteria)]
MRTKTSPARIAVAVLSVLVLLVTGFAWRGVDSLRNSLATASGLGLGGGKDGAIDILMVGTDSRTDAHGNPLSQSELDSLRAGEEVASNTDTIILIRVPNDGSSATAISIPRDAYVNVPGIGMSKINAAFGATKETERLKLVNNGSSDSDADKKSTEAGRTALIGAVANLTGITVDHYAEVGLLGFVLLTNAVGGVDVCLNAPVDEPMSGANFAAGKQTLD